MQTKHGGKEDAFITQFSADGQRLNFSTYLGGKNKDQASSIAIDPYQHIFIAGQTQSKKRFPLINALQNKHHGGDYDGFISKLSANGQQLLFSSYLGGNKKDQLNSLALDSENNLYVFGTTKSKKALPLIEALQTKSKDRDAYLAKISEDGDEIHFASYKGGDDDDYGIDITSYGQSIYLTGITESEHQFPLQNALQNQIGGDLDAFIAKISPENLPPQITSTAPVDAISGQLYQYQVKTTDPDNDEINHQLITAPTGMQINANTGLIEWTPTNGGQENISIEVNDNKVGRDQQNYTINITAPDTTAPNIQLINPIGNDSFTNQSELTFIGQLNENATLLINNVPVPINADLSFVIGPISLEQGLNHFTLTAIDNAGNISSREIRITLDTTHPEITLITPQTNSLSKQAEIHFSGQLSEPATLTLQNQTIALDADNHFAENITLAEGENNVELTATDPAGNSSSKTLSILIDTIAPAINLSLIHRSNPQNQIVMVSGQPGAVEAGALIHISNPANNSQVSTLAQSNGSFSTDIAGYANDSFKLYALDAAKNRSIEHNLQPVTPTTLTLNTIGNKIAPLGQTTRFTVTANDSLSSPITLRLTPVPLPDGMDYNIKTGEFSFRPSNGQEGDYPLTFSALNGDQRVVEQITITVPAIDPQAPTIFTGRLLDANSYTQGQLIPIVGATVSFLNTGVTTTSNADGYFTLSGLPNNATMFDIDASTATPGPGGVNYGSFREGLSIAQNTLNQEERPFFLPRIAAESLAQVKPTQTTIVNNPKLGISLTVPANTAKNPDGTNFTGQLSISQVPLSLAPVAMPDTFQPALLITVQPVGVTFSRPVAITYPNIDQLPADTEVDLYQVDRELGKFVIIGTGLVSADGQKIETISGGITATTWGAPAPQPPVNPEPKHPDIPDLDNPCNCPRERSGSTVTLRDGRMGTEFSLPAYRSLETSRTLSFSYQTNRANPKPVVPFNIGLQAGRVAIPTTISYELSVGGIKQGQTTYLDTRGLRSGEVIRSGLAFDASDIKTGMYNYRRKVMNNFSTTTIGNEVTGDILIINEEQSTFGAGWMLKGLYRLAFNPDNHLAFIRCAQHYV